MELLNELSADHWAIRDFLNEIRMETISPERRSELLSLLGRWLSGHAAAEEKTIDEYGKAHDPLRVLAYEDGEEHNTVETLLAKLQRTDNPYLWQARLHLFLELIEHHLDEEEQEYFPLLKREPSRDQNEFLAEKYRAAMRFLEPSRPHPPSGILGWLSGRPQPSHASPPSHPAGAQKPAGDASNQRDSF